MQPARGAGAAHQLLVTASSNKAELVPIALSLLANLLAAYPNYAIVWRLRGPSVC